MVDVTELRSGNSSGESGRQGSHSHPVAVNHDERAPIACRKLDSRNHRSDRRASSGGVRRIGTTAGGGRWPKRSTSSPKSVSRGDEDTILLGRQRQDCVVRSETQMRRQQHHGVPSHR